MILEFWKGPDEPNSGWVHCSYKNEKVIENKYLRAYKEDGKNNIQKNNSNY